MGMGHDLEHPAQSVFDHLDLLGMPKQQVCLKVVMKKYSGVFVMADDDLVYTEKIQYFAAIYSGLSLR